MKKTLKKILKVLISFAFLLVFYFTADAQLIDRTNGYPAGTTFNSSCPDVGCEITLPQLNVGETVVYTIPLLNTVDTLYTSTETGNCTILNGNFTISLSGNQITVEVTEKCNSGSSTLSFLVHAEKTGFSNDQVQYHIPIVRDRAKISLVLDISGSMNANVQGTTNRRIDELKTAVNLLVPKLELFKQANDSLSLTYFSSTSIQPEVTYFPKDFILIDNPGTDYVNWSSERVYGDLDPREPIDMTALGEGLADAKNKLDKDDASNVRRMVFLFTDGMQNWGNQLKADGLTFQSGTDSLNNYQSDPKDSIYYFPVATWGAGDQPTLFQNIVDANKGEVLFVTPSSTLTSWFNNQLVNMLHHGSPQIVKEKSFDGNSGINRFDFQLNDNINSLVVEQVSKAEINMRIFKDSVDVTSKARVRSGDGFNLINFTFPIITSPVIHSGGKWSIVVDGNTDKLIELAVIADDHFSNFNCSVNNRKLTLGDSILFKVKLDHNGTLLSGTSNDVKAILLKPGDDLGNLLSIYQTPDNDTEQLEDIDSDVANKYNELLASDTAFYNALLPDEQIINLTDNESGEYTGHYTNTDLTGIYNVIYLINANIPNYGKLQRTKSLSIILEFGQVEEAEPEVVDNAPPPSSGNQFKYMVLKIRPKNKYGYFMGPGFKSNIKVRIKTQNVKPHKTSITNVGNDTREPFLEEIKDNLDGSYYLYIANLDDPAKWEVAVDVSNEELYNYAKSISIWIYVIALILLILAILLKKAGKTKTLFWILFIIWLIFIILKYFEIINFI